MMGGDLENGLHTLIPLEDPAGANQSVWDDLLTCLDEVLFLEPEDSPRQRLVDAMDLFASRTFRPKDPLDKREQFEIWQEIAQQPLDERSMSDDEIVNGRFLGQCGIDTWLRCLRRIKSHVRRHALSLEKWEVEQTKKDLSALRESLSLEGRIPTEEVFWPWPQQCLSHKVRLRHGRLRILYINDMHNSVPSTC